MAAYYNEFDPFAAQWLRELIKCGFIADGVVDERSITEVKPEDLKEFTQCHFFAGIGGWSYALRLAGVPDEFRLWTGSCPCQAFSTAGKQRGFKDERHLWPVFSKLIDECRPAIVLGEQVEAAIKYGWLDLVQDDLESYGYACASAVLPAASVGAPHIRHRLYWGGVLANAFELGPQRQSEMEGQRSEPFARSCDQGDGDTESVRLERKTFVGLPNEKEGRKTERRPIGDSSAFNQQLENAVAECSDNTAIPIDMMNLNERRSGSNGIGVGDGGDPSYTLTKGHSHGVSFDGCVRRLTPVECERLQGFPDGYTQIPYRGKPAEKCPDAPRYKALGNSWAVPVVRWIGERINLALMGL